MEGTSSKKESKVKVYLHRYFIDAMSAMAQGLFASLIIGLILQQLGKLPYLTFLTQFSQMLSASSPVVGAAIGVAVSKDMKVMRFGDNMRNVAVTEGDKVEVQKKLGWEVNTWAVGDLVKEMNAVTEAEKALEKSIRNEDLLALMKLEKSMVFFNTSIRGNEVMLAKLQNIFQEPQYIDKDLVEDVEIELKQAHNTVNIYSDILTGTMDAFASIISNNVNTIMKRMTSLSIILMVPTLIASFYGMNVPIYMEDMPHGFVVIILLSILLSATAFFIFRKIKWF